jgi:hypothetical protein
MYALLLIFGAAITAAGIGLSASGVSIQEHTFDPAIITPGIVALIGGLMLIGLGLALRTLARIEQVLVGQSLSLAPRPAEIEPRVAAAEQPITPTLPFPTRPAQTRAPALQTEVAVAESSPAPAAEPGSERLREKFPGLVRVDSAPVVEETDVSLLPKSAVRADEEATEPGNGAVAHEAVAHHAAVHQAAVHQANGNGAVRSTTPRLEVSARPTGRAERRKGFDAFWPKRQRPDKTPEVAMPAPASEPPVEPEAAPAPSAPEPAGEPPIDADPPEVSAADAPAAVSVLKSGVVDGMAYTLYSDGSIEAQLPQGMLRFGSIAELRNHIEHGV